MRVIALLVVVLLLVCGCVSSGVEVTVSEPIAPSRSNLADVLLPADGTAADVLFAGTQVAPAIVLHHWTDTAIVAFQEGRWARCPGAAVLRVARVTVSPTMEIRDVGSVPWSARATDSEQCFGQPHLAMSTDGDVVLLASELHCRPGSARCRPSLFFDFSFDQGRTSAQELTPFQWNESIVALQAITGQSRGFVLVTRQPDVGLRIRISDDNGRHWTIPHVGLPLFPEIASQRATLTQCPDRKWVLTAEDGSRRESITAGRSWNPKPTAPATVRSLTEKRFYATLFDRAYQPFGFDAQTYSAPDRPVVTPNLSAHLYDNIGWRTTWAECRDVPFTIDNIWPIQESSFPSYVVARELDRTIPVVVDGRSCGLAAVSADAMQTMPWLARCVPDGTRLGTSYYRVHHTQSVPRFAGANALGIASGTESAQPPAVLVAVAETISGDRVLLLERENRSNFTLDLLLNWWGQKVLLLQHDYPVRKQAATTPGGYFNTDDYWPSITGHPTRRQFFVAFSQVTRDDKVPDADPRPTSDGRSRRDDFARSYIVLGRAAGS
jgi:hypothetical protein